MIKATTLKDTHGGRHRCVVEVAKTQYNNLDELNMTGSPLISAV